MSAFQDATDDAWRAERRSLARHQSRRKLQRWMAETDQALEELEQLNIANADLAERRKQSPDDPVLRACKPAPTPPRLLEQIGVWCSRFEGLAFHPVTYGKVQGAINALDAIQEQILPLLTRVKGTYWLASEQFEEDDES